MSLLVTLLGTGSPIPAPDRAGPATLVSTGAGRSDAHHLVDAGRGVLMRLAAVGLGATDLSTVLLTHLHSDHITDLGDIITTRWVMTLEPDPAPLRIVGPVGTRTVVDRLLDALAPDIGYRTAHHPDLPARPPVEVTEVTGGTIGVAGPVAVRSAPTDHRPVEPSVGYRFDAGGASVVVAGDTVPCPGLDELSAGAGALVHSVIRKDLIGRAPVQRLRDILDYHSSPGEAGATATRAGVGMLLLTHFVPPPAAGAEDEWRTLAADTFAGRVEVAADLHRVTVSPARSDQLARPPAHPPVPEKD